jgi:hypothetical protein
MPEPISEYSAQINQEIKDKKIKLKGQRILPVENAGALSQMSQTEKRVPDLRKTANHTGPTGKTQM